MTCMFAMTFLPNGQKKRRGWVSVAGPFNRGIAVSWTVSWIFFNVFSEVKGLVRWEFEEVTFPEKKMKTSGVHRNTPFSMGKVFAKLWVDKTTLRWMVLLMVKRDAAKQWKYVKHRVQLLTRCWFQIIFGIFTPICGGFPFWHILTN